MRRASHPPRAISELLDDLGGLARALDAERAVAGPDSDPPDVHADSVANPGMTAKAELDRRWRTPVSATRHHHRVSSYRRIAPVSGQAAEGLSAYAEPRDARRGARPSDVVVVATEGMRDRVAA